MVYNTINSKPCNYNCGTRIYWNTSENAYLEVFAKKKHICPNRSLSNNMPNNNNNNNNKKQVSHTNSTPTITSNNNNKPSYYYSSTKNHIMEVKYLNQKCLIP